MRKLAIRTLGIGIVMAMLGLGATMQARAQGTLFYPNGSVWMASAVQWKIITNACDQPPKPVTQAYLDCADTAIDMVNFQDKSNGATGSSRIIRPTTRLAPQADPPFALTLSSGTPYLPFLGNPLVEVSWVPNATEVANITAFYTTGLRRQSNCSLDEDFTLPTAATPSAGAIASVTGAQDYLHQLAGLTTTADVFAKGCDYQVLGLPTTTSILLLGTTADGAAISARVTLGDDLTASVTDPVANTVTTTTLDGSGNVLSFSAASLRGNGIMDVVEPFQTDPATSKPAIVVFLGNGDGTFKPPVYYDVADDFNLTIDDVNGDGIPDIVVGGAGTLSSPVTVTTLIGKGDGTFTIGPVSSFNVAGGGGPMVTGVFKTGDVKDLLIGAGNGSFTQGPTTAAFGGAGAVGDLRNNGKLDVVVSQRGSVAIFYGNGDGTFSVGPRYAGPTDLEQVTITDIDGDGNQDIVIGTSTGGIYTLGGYDTEIPMYQILMGRGDGTFVDSLVYNQGTYNNGGVEEIASADFTGDGNLDLLVLDPIQNGTGALSQLLVLPGDGKGNLGTAITSPINIVPELVVEADMNGDGKPDIIISGQSSDKSSSDMNVLLGNGDGTFQPAIVNSFPLEFSAAIAIGDINGDGKPDLYMIANGTNSCWSGRR